MTNNIALIELISDILKRYDFPSISKDFQAIPDSLKGRVGFIGEFNSGKSSLINAMIDQDVLPVGNLPTTATIITVESNPDVANFESNIHYIIEAQEQLREIDRDEFYNLTVGEDRVLLKVEIPTNKYLPEGLHLIDTPGLQALTSWHDALTVGQLPQLDGLVVCLPAHQGGIGRTILDFVNDEKVIVNRNRTIFVITIADQLSPINLDQIKSAIGKELSNSGIFGRVIPPIITSSAHGHPGIDQIRSEFLRFFKLKALQAERHKKHLMEIGTLLKKSLEGYRDGLVYNDSDFQKKVDGLEVKLTELKASRDKTLRSLSAWCQELQKALEVKASLFKNKLAQADPEELNQVTHDLHITLQEEVDKHITTFVTSQGELERLIVDLTIGQADDLTQALKSRAQLIQRSANLLTMAATAGLTASAGVAVPLAVEGGAAAGWVFTAGAKKVAADAAKSAANKVLIRQVASGLASFINEANPINLLADIVKDNWNDATVSRELPKLAGRLADAINKDMQNHTEKLIFTPLKRELDSVQNAIQEAGKLRKEELTKHEARKATVSKDLKSLQDALSRAND